MSVGRIKAAAFECQARGGRGDEGYRFGFEDFFGFGLRGFSARPHRVY